MTGCIPLSSSRFVRSRRIVTIQFRIPGDISSTDIFHRQDEIWIGGTTGSRGSPRSTTASYRPSSTEGFPCWRPNRTPTRSCDASYGSRDTVRRNELYPGLVYRFGLREPSQPAPRIMRVGLGRWKSCPYCDRYQLGFSPVSSIEDRIGVNGKPRTGGPCTENYIQG